MTRFAGIAPIEVWDLPVEDRTLQHFRHDASFPARLAGAIAPLCARSRIDRVHLVGGGASEAMRAAIEARGLPCARSEDPLAAARAGAALVGGRCADVGQTSIKIVDGDRAWTVARDLVRAPLRDEVPIAERDAARASTLAFLAEQIGGARRLLLGLPCEIDPSGHPLGCTYAWRAPDPDVLPSLMRATGATITLANDAELAALAARVSLPPGPRTLVLTIGFGVGGAILDGTR